MNYDELTGAAGIDRGAFIEARRASQDAMSNQIRRDLEAAQRARVTMVEGLEKAARPSDPEPVTFEGLGNSIGKVVAEKNRQYGDSAKRSGAIMRILYPNGIAPHQTDDALLTVRVLDKLSRIAERGADGKDLGGETPWKDVSGYGLLGWRKDGGA